MAQAKKETPTKQEQDKDQPISQPDPETLHKTDPQENMKGPVSSLVNKTRENIEDLSKKEGVDDEDIDEKGTEEKEK